MMVCLFLVSEISAPPYGPLIEHQISSGIIPSDRDGLLLTPADEGSAEPTSMTHASKRSITSSLVSNASEAWDEVQTPEGTPNPTAATDLNEIDDVDAEKKKNLKFTLRRLISYHGMIKWLIVDHQ